MVLLPERANLRSCYVRNLFLSLILSACALAQQAAITALIGRVTDSNGAAIPGATVKAVDDGTHETYSGTTNEAGLYFFQFVKIGTYSITATANGFATVTRGGVVVEVNQ